MLADCYLLCGALLGRMAWLQWVVAAWLLYDISGLLLLVAEQCDRLYSKVHVIHSSKSVAFVSLPHVV